MRKTFTKHSAAERLRLYQIYQHEFSLGNTTEEIARKLNISASTLYRWQRQAFNEANTPFTKSKTISNIIEVLSRSISCCSYQLVDNICSFNAWLRWPRKAKYHYHATTAAILQYTVSKYGTGRIGDLNDDFSHGINSRLSLHEIANTYSPNFTGHVDFVQYNLGEQKYTEIEVAANLGWYLFISKDRPTFDGAYKTLSEGVGHHTYDFSRSTFQEFWRNYLPSAPFLFVQTYYSGLTWTPDPFSPAYRDLVDEIISQPSERRDFFANARAAVSKAKGRVDSRSLNDALQDLAFPDDLPPSTMQVGFMPVKSESRMPRKRH